MSDDAVDDGSASNGTLEQAPTAGLLLRRAREAAGLHVAALAVSMKVPVKKLELLEADRLDLLPDAVFVRALASSVCRALKIDAAPVLKLLPHTSAPRLDAEERGINTPFHAAGDFKARTLPAFLTRPTALWVAALLLGVLVVAFFPESSTMQSTSAPPVAAVSKEAAEAATAPVMSSVSDQPNLSASAPAFENAKPLEVAKPVADMAPAVPTPVAIPVAAPAVSNAASGGAVSTAAILTLKAKGETWVEVTDSKGVVQFRKILAAGEVASASGATPLSVVIGRADMTAVEVRGQAFSLDAISKDNVARFEVK